MDSVFFTRSGTTVQMTSQPEDSSTELQLRVGETVGNLRCHRIPTEYYWVYTPRDKLRWLLAGSCMRDNDNTSFLYLKSHIRYPPVILPSNILSDRITNWPPDFTISALEDSLREKTSRQLLAAFTLADVSYGALHLLAWNFHFTSHAEHLLWQISGVTIATSGPALVVMKLLVSLLNRIPDRVDHNPLGVVLLFMYIFLLGAYGLLYLFSRVYLIVESFISFTYLPDAAFQQPQWTYYFPHVS